MTKFVERTGDILEDDADALVNPVNCRGVMGKGLARAFRDAWPEMFASYQVACRHSGLYFGALHVWVDEDGGPVIVNLPTKDHWRERSDIHLVGKSVLALRNWLKLQQGVHTVAVPAVGCGNGQLEWFAVHGMLTNNLYGLEQEIRIYAPT